MSPGSGASFSRAMLAAPVKLANYWFTLAASLKETPMKLVLVNPYHVKRSKELDDGNPTKNDRKDPKTIAKLVLEGRYQIPYIPESLYAELRTVMNLLLPRLCRQLGCPVLKTGKAFCTVLKMDYFS